MRFIIIFIIILLFPECGEDKRFVELEKIQIDKNISDEEALVNISKLVYRDYFKKSYIEKKENSNYEMTIEYGGDRALTFLSKKNYSKDVFLTASRFILEMYKYSHNRNLSVIRLSLIKPFYLKDPNLKKEMIEEFEVLRIKMDYSELKKIIDPEKISKEDLNSSRPSDELMNTLKLIIKNWTVELNELNRVEIK